MADPEYCEPVLAGWWAWGANVWIGDGWCAGDGPWTAGQDDEGVPTFARGNAGAGVNRQLPHLGNAGAGVNRQLPHLGAAGTGVNRKLPQDKQRMEWIKQWFIELQDHLRDVRVACGDWTRICAPRTMIIFGTCAVVMDPPYSLTAPVYANDGNTISANVRQWCIENEGNKLLRIALCGHDGEHNELEQRGWSVATWTKMCGYSRKSDDRERIWFSPHCMSDNQTKLF